MRLHQVAFHVGIGIALLSCGGDSTGPSYADVAGTYDMVGFEGHSLPAPLPSSEGVTAEIVGGTEVLNADHSYQENWIARHTYQPGFGCGCVQTHTSFVDAGTFELKGVTIIFHSDYGDDYTGVLFNGRLTYTGDFGSVIYQK